MFTGRRLWTPARAGGAGCWLWAWASAPRTLCCSGSPAGGWTVIHAFWGSAQMARLYKMFGGGAVQEPYKKMHAGECSLTHLMKGEAVSLPPRSQSWSTLSTYGWIPPRT